MSVSRRIRNYLIGRSLVSRLIIVLFSTTIIICLILATITTLRSDTNHTLTDQQLFNWQHAGGRRQRYLLPQFCTRYLGAVSNGSWSHGMKDVPTSLKPMDLATRETLQKELYRGELASSEIKTFLKYRDCPRKPADSSLVCDDDCQRLHKLFSADTWPKNKPKSVIHFLMNAGYCPDLNDALRRLDVYFNDQFQYPVILFTDDAKLYESRERLRNMTKSDVFIQLIDFKIPPHVRSREIEAQCCGDGSRDIGYRHMCQFHAFQMYDLPILDRVEYVWRLDTDSKLLRTISYDVFQYMKVNEFDYGYYMISNDTCLPCCHLLWETSCKYVSEQFLRTEFFHTWHPQRMFFNNFEISAMSVWRSCAYRDYVDYIDRLGGIYYNRWGDAIIKSVGLSLILPWDRIHHFNDIGYKHQHEIQP